MIFPDTLYVRKVLFDEFDSDGNPVDEEEDWVEFGRCVIFPNTKAANIRSNDGTSYCYTYEVVAPLKSSLYPIIPKEGDEVRIIKKDETVDETMKVAGFVTLKQRYLKIWV